MQVPIFKFANKEQTNEYFAQSLIAAASYAIETKGFANIALSGGSTPKNAYIELAKANIDWSKVNIALVDDRWVNIQNDASNEKMIKEAFKDTKANIISMTTDDASPFDGIEKIEERYKNLRSFDAIALGMGNDGHTASWFPSLENLDEIMSSDNQNTICAIDAKDSEIAKDTATLRISLTMPPIKEAPMNILLIFGDKKLEILENGLENNNLSLPIVRLINEAPENFAVFWAK